MGQTFQTCLILELMAWFRQLSMLFFSFCIIALGNMVKPEEQWVTHFKISTVSYIQNYLSRWYIIMASGTFISWNYQLVSPMTTRVWGLTFCIYLLFQAEIYQCRSYPNMSLFQDPNCLQMNSLWQGECA